MNPLPRNGSRRSKLRSRAWGAVRRTMWVTGWPVRVALIGTIRAYRVLVGPALGGGCRFYPSCSHYAEGAIRSRGAVAGVALAAWRLLRCHPWSRGGIDHPPSIRARGAAEPYEDLIHSRRAA